MALLIFMVDEVAAVQDLVAYLGGADAALIHVDAKQPEAALAMWRWAEARAPSEPNVVVRSLRSVMRQGYSAGAALLDLLEVALRELPAWDSVLFLSAAHFPIRPRWELRDCSLSIAVFQNNYLK